MIDAQLHPWNSVGEPVLKEMLIPRPMPDDSVGHLGLELWTYAAMMAPAHLRSLGEPRLHFTKLNDEWLAEISDLESRLRPGASLDELEAGEVQIRQRRPWATPELVHPIWDGTSDNVELEMEMAPVLGLEVAVMLLEHNGTEIMRQIKQSVAQSDPNGTPTSNDD